MSVWDELSGLLDAVEQVLGFETSFVAGRGRRTTVGLIPEMLRLRVLREARLHGGDVATAKHRLGATRKTSVGLGKGQSLEGIYSSLELKGLSAAIARRNVTDTETSRAYRGFANVLVGKLTERHFSSAYQHMLEERWKVRDLAGINEEVDFELTDRDLGTTVRINVKNASEMFAEASAFVGVDAADCVPLGIYKIFTAIGLGPGESQLDVETLLLRKPPLLWVYLVDWGLSERIQSLLSDFLNAQTQQLLEWLFQVKISYSRDIENLFLDRIIEGHERRLLSEVSGPNYHAISSRKVFRLLSEGQWATRVPKLHVPRAQGRFGGEIGTHLSVAQELTPWEPCILAALVGEETERQLISAKIDDGRI